MNTLSRRQMFRLMFRGKDANAIPPVRSSAALPPAAGPPLALILDRFCLAWQGSFCSVCYERCPVAGAIEIQQGRPRVEPNHCNGCMICQDVCPAPQNAVFRVDRQPKPGMIAKSGAPDPS